MKKTIFIISLFLIFVTTSCYAATRNSYTLYGKHIMPTYFDPFFITNFENCAPNEYVDWTGTYKYIIEGLTDNKVCKYKSQYNPWLKQNRNEWIDYKTCDFNEIQRNELTVALKEHSNRISSYTMSAYKMTGTKLEYLLYSYEYRGACRFVYKKK